MDSRLEIWLTTGLTATANTQTIGTLDLYDSEPISLTYSIANLKKFNSTTGTFSQNFTVPGTANNNKLFGDIFLITEDSNFDARKKVMAHIIVDSIPVISYATLQLVSISLNENKVPTYNISIIGDTGDLLTSIGQSTIGDLSFSGLTHAWHLTAMQASWTAAQAGTGSTLGYYYPMIDYGYNLDSRKILGLNDINNLPISGYTNIGMSIDKMFPAVYAKTIIDRIFSAAGYTYSSSILNSTHFKQLVHPFTSSKDWKLDQSFIENRTVNSFVGSYWDATGPVIYPNYAASFTVALNLSTGNIQIPTNMGPTVQTPFNNVFPTIFYSADTNMGLTVTAQIEVAIPQWSITQNRPAWYTSPPNCQARLYRNTGSGFILIETLNQSVQTYDGDTASPNYNLLVFNFTPLSNTSQSFPFGPALQGEIFYVEFAVTGNAVFFSQNPASAAYPWIKYGPQTGVSYKPTSQIVPGQTIDFNKWITGGQTKQIDYLKSIVSMYNLFIIPDSTRPKHFTIETRDEFYTNVATKDWTLKLDHSQPITETLLSEFQNKRIKFTHKKDSDYENDFYEKSTDRIYGDYIFNSENDFLTSETKLETIFSPTPFNYIGNNGDAQRFLYPIAKIFKLDNNGNAGRTDANLRIGYVKNLPLTSFGTGFNPKVSGTNIGLFPYFGQYDNPGIGSSSLQLVTSASTWNNINFDESEFMFDIPAQYTPNLYTTNPAALSASSVSLYNNYWRKTLEEITDKNSKLITCYIKLDPQDINELNFSDKIYLFGTTPEGGEYYRLNSVEYNPTSNAPSKVELLKIKEALTRPKPNLFSGGTLGTGGWTKGNSNTGTNSVIGTGNIAIGEGNAINSLYSSIQGSGNLNTGSFNDIIGYSNILNAGVSNSSVNGLENTINDYSTYASVIGTGNTVGVGTVESFIYGNDNSVANSYETNFTGSTLTSGMTADTTTIFTAETVFITSSFIFGDNNAIASATSQSTIYGNDNIINTGATSNNIFGNNNVIESDISGTTIFGFNVTATTSDSVYIDNLYVNTINGYSGSTEVYVTGGTYSAGTAIFTNTTGGTFSVTGFTTGSTSTGGTDTYWTSGSTGTGSIKSINSTGLDALGNYSLAEGNSTTASGESSHAEGAYTHANGLASHAEGTTTIANGSGSHSEGGWSVALGDYTHAEGYESTATTISSHAEGFQSHAFGQASHAEGQATLANGTASHTEGNLTTANGNNSHAGGYLTLAVGDQAFVHGENSVANGTNVIVFGENITGTTDNTTYVDMFNIKTLSTGTSIYNLGINSSGFIVSASSGTNNFCTDGLSTSGITGCITPFGTIGTVVDSALYLNTLTGPGGAVASASFNSQGQLISGATGNASRISNFIIFNDWVTTNNSEGYLISNISNGNITNTASTREHIGVVSINDSTTINGGAIMFGANFLTNPYTIYGDEKITCILKAVDGRTSTTGMIGFTDNLVAAGLPANGVYLYFSGDGTNMLVDGRTSSASTSGITLSNYTLSANTWATAIVELDTSATTATFSLYDDDGVSLWSDTLSSNIPTAPVNYVVRFNNSSTDAAQSMLYVDYTSFEINRTLNR